MCCKCSYIKVNICTVYTVNNLNLWSQINENSCQFNSEFQPIIFYKRLIYFNPPISLSLSLSSISFVRKYNCLSGLLESHVGLVQSRVGQFWHAIGSGCGMSVHTHCAPQSEHTRSGSYAHNLRELDQSLSIISLTSLNTLISVNI